MTLWLKEPASLTENNLGRWMMKFFSGLLSILEEQTRCYERIYQFKEAEQRLVVTGPPEALQRNTEEINSLTLMIRSLEKARQEITEALAEQFQMAGQTLNLEQVIGLADEESAKQLRKIADRLVAVLNRTSRINEDNAFLIRRSLDIIDRSLEVLTGLSVQRETYGHDGRPEQKSAATLVVDHRA